MTFEVATILVSGLTAGVAFYSVLSALRKARKEAVKSVSISIRGANKRINIDATGMSEKEILHLINSLQSDEGEPENGEVVE